MSTKAVREAVRELERESLVRINRILKMIRFSQKNRYIDEVDWNVEIVKDDDKLAVMDDYRLHNMCVLFVEYLGTFMEEYLND